MSRPELSGPCPICEGPLFNLQKRFADDAEYLECGNCGDHWFTRHAIVDARGLLADPQVRARVAHAVFRCRTEDTIDARQLDNMARLSKLPPALERLNLLVVHMATTMEPGGTMSRTPKYLRAMLGCATPEAVEWVLAQAEAEGLLIPYTSTNGLLALSAKGWQRFAELERTGKRSRRAVMAMAYGPPEVEALYSESLKKAVSDTGFELRRVDGEHKDTSLIDVRMQVELHTCRFVVCDLSDHNRGAYWEAGFATGLGRPVFYLCRSEVLKKKAAGEGPHFDTAHYPIIEWNPADHAPAMRILKDMIRATLPDEAHMRDPLPG